MKTKIEGGEIKRTPTSTKSSGEVVDLLAALQRSVDAAKSGRSGGAAPDDAGQPGEAEDEDEAGRPAAEVPGEEGRQEGDREEGARQEGPGEEGRRRRRPPKKAAAKKTPAKKAS